MDTKKLRQKILDLAIRGKLVPQDPNDEPASVLLERIRAEKERLIKEGKIKRSKKSASDTPHYENRQVGEANEMPFEVPEGWEWVRLSDIAYFGGGKTPSMDEKRYWQNGRNLWVTSKDMKCDRVSDSLMKISDEALSIMTQYNPGTLLMVTRSGILRHSLPIAILEKNATVNQDLKTISIYKGDIAEYIFYAIKANEKFILKEYHKDGTTVDSINFEKFADILLPLPPKNEQQRIIKSLHDWLGIAESLEIDKERLLSIINNTKSKILDLAIHGKLVPQDPNDEPAIELLKRINPKFTPCENEHDAYQLPDSWCWTTLEDICDLVTGSTPSKLHPEYYGGDFPFYKPSDLDAGRHVNIPSEFLTGEGKNVTRIIPVGATAICCIGSIGKCGYIEKEGATNQQINSAVPSKSLNPLYLYYFCNSGYFIEELLADSSAITISIVNKSKLSKMILPLPPLSEQLRIVAKTEELFAVLDEIQKSIEA